MTLEEAKRIDITEWLDRQGYQPAYRSGENCWYLSMLPGRTEHTPSFKVNTRLNRWIDFGNGEKGSLIDLGVLYHRCTIGEFLNMLDCEPGTTFQQQPQQTLSESLTGRTRIIVREVRDLRTFPLLQYLRQRHIPLEIARQYCREVEYQLGQQQYLAIGFPNRSGGFELRNARIKATASPKDSSWLQNGAPQLAVFEGFFDFLSHQTFASNQPRQLLDYLVLNSTALFNKNLPSLLNYDCVDLYLDRDKTGQKLTLKALELDPKKFVDCSPLYSQYKDLNELLIRTTRRPRQRPSLGP